MRYDAFISYSTAADGKLARALQLGLQRLAKPWFRRPIIKVFRDASSLSASPGLWTELERNLAETRYFILLASPEAAGSQWVQREVAWWIAHRPLETFFIGFTAGALRWKNEESDFDWSATTSLPTVLKAWFKEEPLYVDLTWAKGLDQLSLRHSQFRSAVLDLAAPLHQKPKDELDSEDIRQNRRLRTAAWSAVAAIALLGVISAIAAVVAVQNANEAERQTITALSRQHAVEAQLHVREGRLESAVTAALKAERTQDTAEARAALFETLEAAWDIHAVLRLHQSPVMAVGFRNEAKELVTWSTDSTLVHWDVAGRRPLRAPIRGERLEAIAAAFSPDGQVLAIGMKDGTAILRNADTMQILATLKDEALGELTALAFNRDGSLLAAGYSTAEIALWDWRRSARAATKLEQSDRLSHDFGMSGLAFSRDGRYLAASNWNPSASVGVWELPAGKLVAQLSASGSSWVNETVAFVAGNAGEASDNYLAITTSDGGVQIYQENADARARFQLVSYGEHHQSRAPAIAAGIGGLATGSDDGLVSVWSDMNEQPIVPASWARAGVSSLAFSENSEYLAAGAADGSVTVYYGRPAHRRGLEDVVASEEIVGFSPDGKWIVNGVKGRSYDERHVSVSHRLTRERLFDGVVGTVTFSPDSRWWVTSEKETMTLRPLSADRPALTPAVARAADRATFAPSGKWLVMERLRADGDIRLFDLTEGVVEHVLQRNVFGHFRAFSQDERLLLTTAGRELRLWDASRGTLVGRPIMLDPLKETDDDDDGDSYVIGFSPDARWILAGTKLGTSSLHRTGEDSTGEAFPVKRFSSAHFSPDGKWVVVQARGVPDSVWNLSTLKPLFESDVKGDASLYFTADSGWLVRELVGERVELWDLRSAEPKKQTLDTKKSQLRLSPDGRRLFATQFGNEAGVMWDLSTLKPHSIPKLSDVYGFSPDGRLTAGLVNGSLAVLNADGTVVARLEGHDKPVDSAAFSPDNQLLASTDKDGSLILWDIANERRLSRTFRGPGDDDDVFYRVGFTPDGMMLDSGFPAHPVPWMEDICRRIEPGLSPREWTSLVGKTPYPWTCDQIAGTRTEDLDRDTEPEPVSP